MRNNNEYFPLFYTLYPNLVFGRKSYSIVSVHYCKVKLSYFKRRCGLSHYRGVLISDHDLHQILCAIRITLVCLPLIDLFLLLLFLHAIYPSLYSSSRRSLTIWFVIFTYLSCPVWANSIHVFILFLSSSLYSSVSSSSVFYIIYIYSLPRIIRPVIVFNIFSSTLLLFYFVFFVSALVSVMLKLVSLLFDIL